MPPVRVTSSVAESETARDRRRRCKAALGRSGCRSRNAASSEVQAKVAVCSRHGCDGKSTTVSVFVYVKGSDTMLVQHTEHASGGGIKI